MTCRDCLHEDVCNRHCELQNDEGCCHCNLQACIYENNAEKCPLFTDKSRFVELPCKIGDTVWCIRNFHGHKHPQEGIVSEMLFTKEMKLLIRVKYVGCGHWGKKIFPTQEEAEAAINKKEKENAPD